MRVVLQRVTSASATVDGRTIGAIEEGLALLVGFAREDSEDDLRWMVDKIVGLRIFADEDGKMNRSVADEGKSLLVVSQFTLYGDARKGRRPSFVDAAPPSVAIPLYERFIELLRSTGLRIATGEFGAAMRIELVNDGPLTLILER